MRTLLFAFCLLVASCSSIPVATDYDTSYDFSAVKTYAWLEPKGKLIADPYVDNGLMKQRVHKSINAAMTSKGYQLLDDASAADVLVSYHLSSHQKLSVTSYHSHFGYYPCRFCYPGSMHHSGRDVEVRQHREGSFIIDIIHPQNRDLLWRGTSERRLPKSATPQQRDDFINETISNILSKFPIK